MIVPTAYDQALIQSIFTEMDRRISSLATASIFIPLDSAPQGAGEGWVSMSDGTGSGFDGASGAGLYRYTSGAWVFVG